MELSLFFSVIILCFSVDTIFSAYWLKLRVLFVQLKMLWSQTQDNGHVGSIHLARLKCSQVCWCSSRWIFWSCSSQWSTRDQTHWPYWSHIIRVCVYKFKVEPTSRCLVRKANDVRSYKMSSPWCRFILSLANFQMKVAVDVLYNRLY